MAERLQFTAVPLEPGHMPFLAKRLGPHIDDIAADAALLHNIGSGTRRVVPFMPERYQRNIINAIGAAGEIFAAPGNRIHTLAVKDFTPLEVNIEELEVRSSDQLLAVQRRLRLQEDAHIDPNFVGVVDASGADPLIGAIDLKEGMFVQVPLSQLSISLEAYRARQAR